MASISGTEVMASHRSWHHRGHGITEVMASVAGSVRSTVTCWTGLSGTWIVGSSRVIWRGHLVPGRLDYLARFVQGYLEHGW